ncbi:MAG: LysM peptidoglycan-binding domain-containing protein [Clostridia bacterium]|nr:LysM peptidoglycan-binding domain-containing protein [Clostridia bacterium]
MKMKKIKAIPAILIAVSVLAVSANAVDHTVIRGDTMWKLSRAYGVTLESVIDANPHIEDPDLIYPGDILHIPAGGDFQATEYEMLVVRLVNAEREKYGLKPLWTDADLCRIARLKSEDMENRRYFSHTSPTYGTPFQMMKDFGIKYTSAGENIAMGQRTPAEVVTAWMNSPGHRANILSASFTRIGVGYVESGNYWTQMFAG